MLWKRITGVFLIFCLMMGYLSLRIYEINNSKYSQAAAQNNSKTITAATSRGTVYDCNMKKLTNNDTEYYAAVKPTTQALSKLNGLISSDEMEKIVSEMSLGLPSVVKVNAASIDCDDIRIIETKKRYSDNQPASNVIGYLESGTLKGISGIEKIYDKWLSDAQGTITVTYSVDATGKVLSGSKTIINDNNYSSKQGVKLTIDKNIQTLAENAAAKYIDSGAVVVMEAKTGKLRAVVSVPSVNPNNISESISNKNSPMINRAFSQYSVGSIFKVVVAGAALENGISPNYLYDCTGYIKRGSVTFTCSNNHKHGVVDMKSALAVSCNSYFINLSSVVGAKKILETAENLGFGTSIGFADGLSAAAGKLPTESELRSPAALANFSFGQGVLMASPVQMAAVYSCVANNGKLMKPTLIESLVDKDGNEVQKASVDPPTIVFSEKTAKELQSFLVNTVENGTGKPAKPEYGSAGGKTATTQSGQFVGGKETNHVWFAGFYPANNPQYAIIAMKEKGSAGGTDCGPVFKEIADGLYNQGYIKQ